jgi:hypothetical protein
MALLLTIEALPFSYQSLLLFFRHLTHMSHIHIHSIGVVISTPKIGLLSCQCVPPAFQVTGLSKLSLLWVMVKAHGLIINVLSLLPSCCFLPFFHGGQASMGVIDNGPV